jgi:aquaporin Z
MQKYFVEFLGTTIFLSSILYLVKNKISYAPYLIGLVLTIVILAGGAISGGHYNPAVSFMFFLNKKLSITDLVGYIISQLLGATVSYLLITNI